MTQITTTKRVFYIEFDGWLYDPDAADYRDEVLGGMIYAACHFDIETQQFHQQVLASCYADLKLPPMSAFSDVIGPMFELNWSIKPCSFEETFSRCKGEYSSDVDFTNPAVVEVCNRLYAAGLQYREWFTKKYLHYFAQALDAEPHAPKYAFKQACQVAGLPIEKWTNHWGGLDGLGYYPRERATRQILF